MKKKQCVVQAQLCRCVMTLEVKGSSSSEILIRANGTSLSFTPREFVIITRLNCVSNRYDFIFDEGVPNRMIEKYFNGAKIIQKRQLFLAFTEKWKIKDFPWGYLSVEDLARSLNNRLKAGGKLYLIQEMPLAIQVWLYECCSNVPSKITMKADNWIPQLLNWKIIAPHPRFEFLMNAMFKDNGKVVFNNIEPTKLELTNLEIPQKDVPEDERSVDSDDDFQDPSPKKINEHSKKKQKAQSKADSHVEEVALSKPERHIEKKAYDEFRDKIIVEKTNGTNLSDSQFTIPDELLPSLNAYRRESNMTQPSTTREEEPSDEHFNNKKFEFVVQHHCQEKNKNIGSSSKLDMHGEVDLSTEEQIMTPPKIQELSTDEQRNEPVCPDSQSTILDKLLPSLNADSSKSIIVHPSRQLQTPVQKIRIRRPFKFKESPYTTKFDSAVESSAGHIHIFPQKHPFAYHPIDGIVDTKIVNKFMDWISEDLLKVHAKRKANEDHFKREKSTIPVMHFGVETVEDKNRFYTMRFPDKTWTSSQIDVCFYYLRKKPKYDPNRSYKFSTVDCNFMNIIRFVRDANSVDDAKSCIFLYESSSHYSIVLGKIEKLATIIPLCLQQCNFYVKKGIQVENHPRYKDKDSSDMFDVLFQENLPQQPSESLDCGVYMVTYAECVSYGHKVLANEFDPNARRIRYVVLLWDYEIQK
ncbi:hypothetical protein FXO38_36086 [Capsicum annuum]|nr:hypothetical protein FXO38_36086 [Capsicum annuum]